MVYIIYSCVLYIYSGSLIIDYVYIYICSTIKLNIKHKIIKKNGKKKSKFLPRQEKSQKSCRGRTLRYCTWQAQLRWGEGSSQLGLPRAAPLVPVGATTGTSNRPKRPSRLHNRDQWALSTGIIGVFSTSASSFSKEVAPLPPLSVLPYRNYRTPSVSK